jgi:hypothetical protein
VALADGNSLPAPAARLRESDLDEDRLRLYRLATHLSLVAGPLRLLDGDFPHPEPMRAIAEHNLRQTLSLLRSGA